MSSSSRERDVAMIAARHHGLITRAQAIACGFDRSAIHRACRSGRWVVVARGVYRIAAAPWTWHSSVLRECLAHDGVASHRTGAVFLKAGRFRPGHPEITVRSASKDHGAGSRVHEALDFDLIRPIIIDGIPVTPPARLGVDLGAVVSFARYEATMDELVARGDVTFLELADHLATHARRGRNGVGALRAYLDARTDITVDGTALEQRVHRDLRVRGFAEPTRELIILDDDGTFLARVDIAFEAERVIVEADSLEWHLNRVSFTKDPKVRRRLRMLGWFVFEITHDMLEHDRTQTYADLRRVLAERRPSATPERSQRVDAVPGEQAPPTRPARTSIIEDLERAFDI